MEIFQQLLAQWLGEYALSAVSMIILITLVAGWVFSLFKINTTVVWFGFIKVGQLISWVVSIGLSFLAQFFGLGMFETLSVLQTVLYGIILGLGANAFYDIAVVQYLLDLVKALSPSQKKINPV